MATATKAAPSLVSENLDPAGDWLLVRLAERDKTTPGGIVIPGTVKDKAPHVGAVLAAGPGKLRDAGSDRKPMSATRGDHVLFMQHSGVPIRVNGEELVMLQDENVLAVVRD